MILLRWFISMALGLSIMISLILLGLISSTTGSVWLIDRLIDASQQEIMVQGVSGRLIDHIQIDSLQARMPGDGGFIKLQSLDLAWNPRALFAGQLRISTLSIETAQYHVDSGTAVKSTQTQMLALPEIDLPWPVYLDQARIHSLEVKTAENTRIFRQLLLRGDLIGTQLKVHDASLKLDDHTLALGGELIFTAPFEFHLQLGVEQKARELSANFELRGTPEAYLLSGTGQAQGAVYPAVDVEFSGQGSMSGIEIAQLRATGLDGLVSAKGRANWLDAFDASLDIQGAGLNIGRLNPKMPGEIDFEGALFWQQQGFNLQLNASGSLLDYPLKLNLLANGNDREFELEEVVLQSGPNLLQLNGQGGIEALEKLQWQLEAPNLSALHQELSGSVSGRGELFGPWAQLQGQLLLQAEALVFKESQIESFKLELLPLDVGEDQFQLKLKLNEIRHQALHVQQLDLLSTGSLINQSMDVALQVDAENAFALHAEARNQAQLWQIQLSDSHLKLRQWPAFNQAESATILLNKAAQGVNGSLSPYCLSGPDEQICLQGEFSPAVSSTSMTLNNIPIRRFQYLLQESEYTKATISGEISLTQQNQHWQLNSEIGMDAQNKLKIELGLQQPQQQLSGHIQTQIEELQWIALFNDALSHTRGRFEAALDVSGTLAGPMLSGQLQLNNAAVNLPGTGTRLERIDLTADIRSDRVATISGEISSGEGTVFVSGDARWWPVSAWQLDLALQGEDFALFNLPELKAVTEPDLSLRLGHRGLAITGDLKLSKLLLALEGLSDQAVTVSEDARIVGVENQAEPVVSLMPFTTRIDILLGNDVRLKGLGLDVKLGGAILVTASPGKPLQANGKIDVLNGSYTAYGQNLSLQQSHLVFNGPPGEPGLDLKAERKIKTVTVGVLVQGTLQNPRSTLYSDTDMPDSDKLAYLLTGGTLDSANAADGSLMLSALTELGVKGSTGLIEKIRTSTGLSTFELDTGDGTSETALKLGRHLTPQLYVQYAKKIFSDSASIEARYQISDKLYFETQSGEDRSIDLKYQFER